MAIAAVNATYLTGGPVAAGQVLASVDQATTEVSLAYTATVTLDGSTTSFALNFIDGTAALPFTPRAVTAEVVGGTQGAAAVITTVTDAATTGVSTTVRLSGAGTNANTIKIAGFILR